MQIKSKSVSIISGFFGFCFFLIRLLLNVSISFLDPQEKGDTETMSENGNNKDMTKIFKKKKMTKMLQTKNGENVISVFVSL